MTAPLQHDLKPANSVLFMLAWMMPLAAGTPQQEYVAAKRWATGLKLPYRYVTRIAGPMTEDADYPTLRIHTLASTLTAAYQEGDRTDSRLRVLADYPGWTVTLGGLVYNCDWLEITEAAHEEPYGAETVVTRVVSECRLCLPFVRA